MAFTLEVGLQRWKASTWAHKIFFFFFWAHKILSIWTKEKEQYHCPGARAPWHWGNHVSLSGATLNPMGQCSIQQTRACEQLSNNSPSQANPTARDDRTRWSESDRERLMPYDVTYIRNLKYDADEHMCETGSQIQRTGWWLLRGWGGEGVDSKCWD